MTGAAKGHYRKATGDPMTTENIRYQPSEAALVARVRDSLPVHYFDCDRFEVYNYGLRQGTCDCTATADVEALLVPSPAARAVALLHEDYHAGKVCFVTDPAECAGHQDAHDITQLLVNAGLLAWGEADAPTQGASDA